MNKPYVLINGTLLTGFSKMKNCALYINTDGTIGDIFNMKRFLAKKFSEDTQVIDVNGSYISSGLIDTHIHGIGGYGTEDQSVESILGMSKELIKYGVTGFLPTIYTDFEENMIGSIKAIVKAMGKEKGAKILGINLEGPFISPEKAGAQTPEAISPVDIPKFKRLLKAGEGKIVCMTVAPELKNMRDLALLATKKNIVLLAGHTNASYENIIEGMQAGILHSTHFFNAMSRLHHRNPGTVGAILIQNDMHSEIICDGVHVHPELVKLLVKDKPLSNIVMVTDSLKPTKQKTGKLYANNVEAILGEDGAFHSADDYSLFIGSALTLIQGVKNMVSWEIPIEKAIRMASTNPALQYNFKDIGTLTPGHKADILVFDKEFNVNNVFIDGILKK